ncbi:MAG: guanylate kinase [Chitinophagaceae bacterium]|nr:guanylate kinase [Chitinophagaceae bacterium]
MALPHEKIILVAAPSGSGKTSVVRYLLKAFPDRLAFSVSCTTRPPREGEKHGTDYYFISVEDFKQRIQNNEFAEWEMVYEGKYYGTLKAELARIWKDNRIPLLDLDVKGAVQIQKKYPETTLSLFIEPPSLQELESRLRFRGTETEESLKMRLSKAAHEMTFKNHFQHIIINDILEDACRRAETIVKQFLGN